jgi:Fe2+ transport system protein FeoA
MSAQPNTLAEVGIGAEAVVKGLRLEGAERRRLLDLGLVPGTHVIAEMRSPLGDPTAYRVRGAIIALRREQAEQIDVEAATETN